MIELQRQLHNLDRLHKRLLPCEIPQPDGWHVAVHYMPGPWSGSVYYDCLPLDDGRILFLVADASDQGAASTALVVIEGKV